MTGYLRSTFACLLTLCGSLLHGQAAREYVRGLFANSTSVQWVRSLDGTVNGIHPVHLTLGYNGQVYRGAVEYDGVVERFELIGTSKEGTLTLQEIDSNGSVVGVIIGKLERDRFSGNWWSEDMARSAQLFLMEKGLVLLERFEPRFTVIEGSAGDEIVDCMLSIESPGLISGTWQRADECVRLLGECDDFLCNNIDLLVLEGALKGARMNLHQSKSDLDVKISGGDRPMNGRARSSAVFRLQRKAEAGYGFLVDMAYPQVNDAGFDAWLAARMEKWYAGILQQMREDSERSAPERWNRTASAWVDIFLFEDEMVSGLVTYFNLKKGQYDREAFIYDIRNARDMPLMELDKRDGELLGELQSRVDVAAPHKNDFRYVVLTEKGFVLFTDFDSIDGDEAHCVSYGDVEEFLKRRALITKLED